MSNLIIADCICLRVCCVPNTGCPQSGATGDDEVMMREQTNSITPFNRQAPSPQPPCNCRLTCSCLGSADPFVRPTSSSLGSHILLPLLSFWQYLLGPQPLPICFPGVPCQTLASAMLHGMVAHRCSLSFVVGLLWRKTNSPPSVLTMVEHSRRRANLPCRLQLPFDLSHGYSSWQSLLLMLYPVASANSRAIHLNPNYSLL